VDLQFYVSHLKVLHFHCFDPQRFFLISNKVCVQTGMRFPTCRSADLWLLMPAAIKMHVRQSSFRSFDPGSPHNLAGGLGARKTRRPARVSLDGIRLSGKCPHQCNENKVYQGNGQFDFIRIYPNYGARIVPAAVKLAF
jgi:hypothetical protein